MMEHLSEDRLDRYLMGDAARAESEHVRSCAACSAEIAARQEMLALFGGSVRRWAAAQDAFPSGHKAPVEKSRTSMVTGLKWAVGILVVFLALFPTLRSRHEQVRQNDLNQDAQLLREVHEQIGRSVPASLEPMLELFEETEASESGNGGPK